MFRKVFVTAFVAAAMAVAPLGGVAGADPPDDPGGTNPNAATPDNPRQYGQSVKFGATEDHDITPGPGNVVGDNRSTWAKNGTFGTGLGTFVRDFREDVGSTPNPPGRR